MTWWAEVWLKNVRWTPFYNATSTTATRFDRGHHAFAFMTLEAKRGCALDLGELVGCAFDFAFTIPLDSKVTESVGRLYPAYGQRRFIGFGDANFIASRDGVWFLEKCERFGYNAHPNLLFNLSRQPLGEVFSSFLDGNFKPNFSGGFGASVTMSTRQTPRGVSRSSSPSALGLTFTGGMSTRGAMCT